MLLSVAAVSWISWKSGGAPSTRLIGVVGLDTLRLETGSSFCKWFSSQLPPFNYEYSAITITF